MSLLNCGVFWLKSLMFNYLIVFLFTNCRIDFVLSLNECSITGVGPSDCSKYSTNERIFYCGGKDNKRIPMKFVNDDYCDCVETGADEPGTAACMNGLFYCSNIGYRGKQIFSSLVNDGICDCCDGSDEWHTQQSGKIKCTNTCQDLANEELKEVKIQKNIYEQGLQAKSRLISVGNNKIEEQKKHISELQNQIGDLQTRTDIAKAKKDSLEEKEQSYREELKQKREEEKAKERENEQQGAQKQENTESEEGSDSSQQQQNTGQEGTQDRQDTQDTQEEREEKDSKDEEFPYPEEYRPPPGDEQEEDEFPYPEEYRYHAKDENGETEENHDDGFDWSEFEDEEETYPYLDNENEREDDDLPYDPLLDDMTTDLESSNDNDNDNNNVNNIEESVLNVKSLLSETYENLKDGVWYILDVVFAPEIQEYLFGSDTIEQKNKRTKQRKKNKKNRKNKRGSKRDIDTPFTEAANTAREEWRTLDRELKNVRRELSSADSFDSLDFGSNNEFASLYDECFTSDINKYTYEFCPFKEANQKEKHSNVRLGKYNRFEIGNENDINSKTIMYFDKGQSCWKGPARSLKVIFECDAVSKIQSVDEPSTCTYEMIFKTPLACKQVQVNQLDHLINHQFKQEL